MRGGVGMHRGQAGLEELKRMAQADELKSSLRAVDPDELYREEGGEAGSGRQKRDAGSRWRWEIRAN